MGLGPSYSYKSKGEEGASQKDEKRQSTKNAKKPSLEVPNQSRAPEGSLLGTLDLAEQSTAVVGLDRGTLGRRGRLIDRLDVGKLVLTLDFRQEARAINLLDMNVSYSTMASEEQTRREASCVSVCAVAVQNTSDFRLDTKSTAA